jgi:acyl-CoA reductase-like NAD-dependent aldehyde dehydrogenase
MVQGVKIENGFILDINPATGKVARSRLVCPRRPHLCSLGSKRRPQLPARAQQNTRCSLIPGRLHSQVIERVKVSTHADVDAAVAAARRAQPGWAALTLAERTAAVKAAVRRIGTIKSTLAPLITKEMGKTIREAEAEVDGNSNMDEYCDLVAAANAAEAHGGSVIVRHPHGVVSICSPWNYPVEEIVLLSIPALIAGNAIVVKPSEVVPLSSGAVTKCLMESLGSAHPGLVQLLQGDGEVGGYLVSHPDVDMCAFTGSTATGAKILEAASRTLKPVVLECGGKDPMLVMEDADLDLAAADAVQYSLQNCGQVCCAVERVYVASAVADEFEAKVKQVASAWVTGDGMQEGISFGPCASEMQRQIVNRHVQAAIKAGARCVLGGVMPPSSEAGTFYPPTVLANVPHSARAITQEEVRVPSPAPHLPPHLPSHRPHTGPTFARTFASTPPHTRPTPRDETPERANPSGGADHFLEGNPFLSSDASLLRTAQANEQMHPPAAALPPSACCCAPASSAEFHSRRFTAHFAVSTSPLIEAPCALRADLWPGARNLHLLGRRHGGHYLSQRLDVRPDRLGLLARPGPCRPHRREALRRSNRD